MPIGNLTSQFELHVYLDELDQFVKHGLKARHCVCYCEDVVLLSPGHEDLKVRESAIARRTYSSPFL